VKSAGSFLRSNEVVFLAFSRWVGHFGATEKLGSFVRLMEYDMICDFFQTESVNWPT